MNTVEPENYLFGESLRAALGEVDDVTSNQNMMCYATSSHSSMNDLQRILVEDGKYRLMDCKLIEGVDGVAQFTYTSPDGDWPYSVSLTYHRVGDALPLLMLLVSIDGRWERFAPSPYVRYETFGSGGSDAEKIALRCEEMHPYAARMWVPDFSGNYAVYA